MADFNSIIQEINTNLPDNNEQLITPEILRNTLIDFVNEVEDSDGDLETAIQNKQDTLTFDNTPTENSDNPVTSDGVYDALKQKADKVVNANSGNFASFDNDGNLIDSGYNEYSFINEIYVKYEELKDMRNKYKLVPGTWYRITNYACTTSQENTQSAGNQFDIIVRADDTSHLNENAFAAHHEGDEYFTKCKLEAWELKYCLDNDTSRFAWADRDLGRGVVFYMKDEWDNECPYDFKNIMFNRWPVSRVENTKIPAKVLNELIDIFGFNDDQRKFQVCFGYQEYDCIYGSTVHKVEPKGIYYYTFSVINYNIESREYDLSYIEDGSIKGNNFYNDNDGGGFYGNIIKPRYNNTTSDNGGIDGAQVLNNIVLNGYYETNNVGGYLYIFGCNNNCFGCNCYDNTLGNDCHNNTFKNGCYDNTLGNTCHNNTFKNGCHNNTFGNTCHNNTLGNNCNNNTFGNNCYRNSFGNDCYHNIFLGDYYYNTFMNNCQNNLFDKYFKTITVFDAVSYCFVKGHNNAEHPTKNAQILNGTTGSENNILGIIFNPDNNCTQCAALNHNGDLKIWIPADYV